MEDNNTAPSQASQPEPPRPRTDSTVQPIIPLPATNTPSPANISPVKAPPNRKRLLWILAVSLPIVILQYIFPSWVDPIVIGESASVFISYLFLPAQIAVLFCLWNLLISPSQTRTLTETQLGYKTRRYALLIISLIAVVGPAMLIYSSLANPMPGGEFFVFALPFFAIPILIGLIGLKKYFSPDRPSETGKTPVSGQLMNAIIYTFIIIIVLFCALLFYSYIQLVSYVSESEKPKPVTLEYALKEIGSCGFLDIRQSKKPDPKKGIEFKLNHYIVYDDSVWPKMVDAVNKAEGTIINEYSGDKCPKGSITPR